MTGFVGTNEVAEILQIPRDSVTRACRNGQLAAVRRGGRWVAVLDAQDRLVYRASRVYPEWRHPRVLVLDSPTSPWPAEVAARIDAEHTLATATPRELQLQAQLDEANTRASFFEQVSREAQAEARKAERRRLLTERDYAATMKRMADTILQLVPDDADDEQRWAQLGL